MMGNLLGSAGASLKQHAVTLYEVGKIANESVDDFLNATAQVGCDDEAGSEIAQLYEHVVALRRALVYLRSMRPVDIIRSQSLRALEVSTRDRILERSYGLMISMAPMTALNEYVFFPHTRALDYMGPSSSLLTSPWLQLYLYASLRSGPPCFVFLRGSRVRQLPRLLLRWPSLLASPFGGDPVTLATCNALDAVNSMLSQTAVMVQPRSTAEQATMDLPLPCTVAPAAASAPSTPPTSPPPGEVDRSRMSIHSPNAPA